MAETIPEGAADPLADLLALAGRHRHVVVSQVFGDDGLPTAGIFRLSLCEDEPDGLDMFAQGDQREIADRLAKMVAPSQEDVAGDGDRAGEALAKAGLCGEDAKRALLEFETALRDAIPGDWLLQEVAYALSAVPGGYFGRLVDYHADMAKSSPAGWCLNQLEAAIPVSLTDGEKAHLYVRHVARLAGMPCGANGEVLGDDAPTTDGETQRVNGSCCPAGDAEGRTVQVSREMALDAGDPSLEGAWIPW